LKTLPGIAPLAVVYLFWQVASLVYPMTWAYYCFGRYQWSEGVVGLSLALVGLSLAAVQIAVLPRAVARFGERRTALIGVCGAATAMFAYIAADQGWMAFALLPLMAMQALVHPNLTSMMTRRATPQTQGEVQGFASGVMAVGSLIAPILFNPVLAYFTGKNAPFVFQGAAFALAALFALACIPILLRMAPASHQRADGG
jgi:MFS transporter, DHA1 family, tetracycline resistance protein